MIRNKLLKKFICSDKVFYEFDASLNDIGKVQYLEEVCFSSLYRHNKKYIKSAILSEYARINLILNHNMLPVAYCNIVYKNLTHRIHIDSICVETSSRNVGLAKHMLNSITIEGINSNYKSIGLEVSEDNIEAQRLYESLGFEHHGTFKNYYSDTMDAFRYRKSLELENLFPSEESLYFYENNENYLE
jgi:RimJ/RimL family protein N-acetyltransferase